MKTYRYIWKEYTLVKETNDWEQIKVFEWETFESEIPYDKTSLYIKEVKDWEEDNWRPDSTNSKPEEELETLHTEYERIHPEWKSVPNNKKNDKERIVWKIEEFKAEEDGEDEEVKEWEEDNE